jgi:hypothetical protein
VIDIRTPNDRQIATSNASPRVQAVALLAIVTRAQAANAALADMPVAYELQMVTWQINFNNLATNTGGSISSMNYSSTMSDQAPPFISGTR